jgi:hypothetical protein
MRKRSVFINVRLWVNKLIYGVPTLCAKHSVEENKARSFRLDSQKCERCSPAEKEVSSLEQDWFNLLSPEQLSLAQSDYEQLIEELNNPREANPKLQEAFQKWKMKS